MTPTSHIEIYQTDDGQTRIELRLEQDTVWLSQAQLGELFDKDVRTVNEHPQNIYKEGELERNPTIRRFRIVRHPKAQHTISTTEQSSVVRHNHCHSANMIHLPV